MIEFVNAKINIGLQIVRKRKDGYHDLQTVFYPVGIKAGLPSNPEPFCDILEVGEAEEDFARVAGNANEAPETVVVFEGTRFIFGGRKIDCPAGKNLVCKAASLFFRETDKNPEDVAIRLYKNLPDGAGMGGGSADASFTLRALASYYGLEGLPLPEWALKLGADCPFFIYNRPMYAEGVGECLEPIALDLSGKWLAVVKPDVYVSTKEAFADVTPKEASFNLRSIAELPVEQWREVVTNDFEQSLVPRHPELAVTKGMLYRGGALYSAMTGSGSCVYGIFSDMAKAKNALDEFAGLPTIERTYLLEL